VTDQTGDATRRTWLAAERTWLAWVRTGLTSTAVAVGVGQVVPGLTDVTRWPYTVLGVGYALLGVLLVVFGQQRRREVEAAVGRGDYHPPSKALTNLLFAATLVLGGATAVVVAVA
jgi:putative membrane protein